MRRSPSGWPDWRRRTWPSSGASCWLPVPLKEVAGVYGVTYPTVRLRLDRLIQKIRLSEDTASDPYIGLIKRLAVNEKLDFDTAKVLISAYKKTKGE